jgi:DNA-binding NarL/FixJ family response regulator
MSEITDTIRLLLVDDQQLLRHGLHLLLEMEPGLQVAGEASNGQEALEAYSRLQPDVVLMDIRMPVMDGVAATRELLQRWPGSKIIILTTFDDDTYVFEGLRAGAMGYLLKDVSAQELAQAIRTVNEGGALIEPSIARKVLAEFSRLPHPSNAVTGRPSNAVTGLL